MGKSWAVNSHRTTRMALASFSLFTGASSSAPPSAKRHVFELWCKLLVLCRAGAKRDSVDNVPIAMIRVAIARNANPQNVFAVPPPLRVPSRAIVSTRLTSGKPGFRSPLGPILHQLSTARKEVCNGKPKGEWEFVPSAVKPIPSMRLPNNFDHYQLIEPRCCASPLCTLATIVGEPG
jgi:hypothetical protein